VGSRHIELGRQGEGLAAAWYVQHGYRVLATNWRTPTGEIDLLCCRHGVLAVVEVKTRRSTAFGDPAEAVTPAKQRRLRRLAGQYLAAQEHRFARIRFDVVAILPDRMDVIEDAF
jgi:putative endonuclease